MLRIARSFLFVFLGGAVATTSAAAEQIGVRCTLSGYYMFATNSEKTESRTYEIFIDTAVMRWHHGDGVVQSVVSSNDSQIVLLEKVETDGKTGYRGENKLRLDRLNGTAEHLQIIQRDITLHLNGSCSKIDYVALPERKF